MGCCPIRSVVSAENTFAVMVLTGTDQEHGMILSRVTLGASATALVELLMTRMLH